MLFTEDPVQEFMAEGSDGGLAGLYPAIRAARLSPTEALAAP